MEKVKEICGIEALSDLLFFTNKRAKVVSMSSIIAIAQDNDVKLYPLSLPKENLKSVEFPYILWHRLDYGRGEGHFSAIVDKAMLDSVHLTDDVNILTDKLPNVSYKIITDEEAKKIKGSKKKTFFGKIAGGWKDWAPQIGMGMIPGVGPLLAGGYGAWRGARKGGGILGGLGGAVGGWGLGGAGKSLLGGLQGLGAGGGGFLEGLKSGWGQYGKTTGSLLGGLPGFGEGGAFRGMLPQGASSYLGYGGGGGSLLGGAGAGFGAGGGAGAGAGTGLNFASIGSPYGFGGGAGVGPTSFSGLSGAGGGMAKKSLLEGMAPYLGAGMMASSTMVPSPERPEFPSIEATGEKTSRLLGALPSSELRGAASEELLKRIRAPLGSIHGPEVDPYSQEAVRLHSEAFDAKKEQIDQLYNFHNAFGTGEHREALAKNEQERQRGIEQIQQESLYRAQQLEEDIRTSAIATSLGVSEQDARILMAMLQEEQAREMGYYSEDVGSADQLRQFLGETGGTLLGRGLFPQQQSSLYEFLKRQYANQGG